MSNQLSDITVISHALRNTIYFVVFQHCSCQIFLTFVDKVKSKLHFLIFTKGDSEKNIVLGKYLQETPIQLP